MVEKARFCATLVSKLYDAPYLKRRLTISNPSVASLYCLPKLHKNPIAMRPIASNINTPMERLAGFVIEILGQYPVTHGFSVKNSIEFAQQIKDTRLNRGEVMVSFDVASLFPSVPVDLALQFLEQHLTNHRADPMIINSIMTITKTCMEQNFFTFRGKIYSNFNILQPQACCVCLFWQALRMNV